MKKFILSDLHIGSEHANYAVMAELLKYIRSHAQNGDKVLGLGDWFHLTEEGFEKCILNNMMAKEFIQLASEIPIELIPGNHDCELASKSKYSGALNPIRICEPFNENGVWYRHGHEEFWKVPIWWSKLWAKLTCIIRKKRTIGEPKGIWEKLRYFIHKKTPGALKGESVAKYYIIAVYIVHVKVISKLLDAKKRGDNHKGIVFGHTHLPLIHEGPEVPFLINSGDMRDSLTFVVLDDKGFHLMRWNSNQWQETSRLEI